MICRECSANLFKDKNSGFAIRIFVALLLIGIVHFWINIAHISAWLYPAIDIYCGLKYVISSCPKDIYAAVRKHVQRNGLLPLIPVIPLCKTANSSKC